MELVVDSSAFAPLLLQARGTERLLALASEADAMLAPDWLLAEIAMTMWKCRFADRLSTEEALDRLDVAMHYDIELVPAEDLLPEALRIACELPHPLYDCLYLLLAMHGGRTLVTADARMRDAAEGLGVRVEWVGP